MENIIHDAGENDSSSGNRSGGTKGPDSPSRVRGKVFGRVGGGRDLIKDPVMGPNALEDLEEGCATEDSGRQVDKIVLRDVIM